MDKIEQINNLIEQNRLDDALKLCDTQDSKVLSLKVKALLKLGRIEEARIICEDEENINDCLIQFEYLKYLIGKNDIKRSFKICGNRNFFDDANIMSIKMSLLNSKHEYVKALHISERADFMDNERILEQRVYALFMIGKKEEAIKICNNPKYIDSERIQLKYIDYFHNNGMSLKALERCENEAFSNNSRVKRKEVRILMSLQRYDEAREICLTDGLKDYTTFKDFLKGIDSKQRKRNDVSEDDKKIISKLLLKIYADAIDFEEINQSNIDIWSKEILTLAYYDKYLRQKGNIFAKELKRKYADDKNKIKFLNIVGMQLANKKITYFDMSKYTEYLDVTVDISKASEYKKEEKTEIEEPKSNLKIGAIGGGKLNFSKLPLEEVKNVAAELEKTLEKSSIIKVEPKMYTLAAASKTSLIKEKPKKDSKPKKYKKYTIGQLFNSFCPLIQRKLYLYMHTDNPEISKRVTTFYDNFEVLMEKEANLETISRMLLVLKINFQTIKFDKSDLVLIMKNKFDKQTILDALEIFDIIINDINYKYARFGNKYKKFMIAKVVKRRY